MEKSTGHWLVLCATVVCQPWMVCATARADAVAPYAEQYRPQYHFSPPRQWMNDPNGMVYLDGEYHLFYQYNPDDTVWGPMHWGHAVSRDLVHWENLPIALYPDKLGTIFSGSAVVDAGNSSGFGRAGRAPLVAIFTSHDATREKSGANDFQNQSIAYSLDKGRTWTKYADNPVLRNPGGRDFRDPKVSWFEPGKKWIMTLAVHDHVGFFSSKDLKHWDHESDFGREWGTHAGTWECPDLMPMPVVGEPARGQAPARYVLLVSVNPGGPNGGSATQYFIGSFDGHEFLLDPDLKVRLNSASETRMAAAALWVDYGTDDYAGVTYSGIPTADGRRLFVGWMSNWTYARKVPTERWRSAMTLPRELSLMRGARGLELRSNPAAELDVLRVASTPVAAQRVAGPLELTRTAHGHTGLLEVELTLATGSADLVTLVFENSAGQRSEFRIDRKLHRYELDRSQSGAVDFDPTFARPQFAPLPDAVGEVSLRVFVDRSSLEFFINHGETVMTAVDFPSSPFDTVVLKASDTIELKSGAVHELRSIWIRPSEVKRGS